MKSIAYGPFPMKEVLKKKKLGPAVADSGLHFEPYRLNI